MRMQSGKRAQKGRGLYARASSWSAHLDPSRPFPSPEPRPGPFCGKPGPRLLDSGMEPPPAAPVAASKAPVLPWMRVPITIDPGAGVPVPDVNGLDPRLKVALMQGLKFSELFPVQAAVWSELAGGFSAAHDLCIAAPTGSGKTLAYALPVVNMLTRLHHGGSQHCLQALVVLPTRDLAAQVHQVFSTLCHGVGLTLGLAAARTTFAAEAAELSSNAGSSPVSPSSKDLNVVDILIATPGRLMAHLQNGTPTFNLDRLKFLVVDETDRLLRQSYQEWLPHVLGHLEAASHTQKAWATACSTYSAFGGKGAEMPFSHMHRVVKLVVSATLTRDPSKLQRLALHCPRYIATSAEDHRYHLPRSLKEFMVVVPAAQKPVALLALLEQLKGQTTVVFTSSVETTHKLYLLLEAAHANPEQVVEFSSHVAEKVRRADLERFRSGSASILVASDAMTRGMDVENVENVVNYDAPTYTKTYVHRAGRTARAGRSGSVYSLLKISDVHHFKLMLRKADNTFVKELKLQREVMETHSERVKSALQQMQQLLEAEAAEEGDAGARSAAASRASKKRKEREHGS
eukprot:gene14822-20875_t